jgi:hypothetical protein
MSQLLKDNFGVLRFASKLSPRVRKKLLLLIGGHEDIYKSLQELSLNTKRGIVPLTPVQLKKLLPHRKLIKRLASEAASASRGKATQRSVKYRKRIVSQTGGFLNIVLPIVSAVLGLLG